MAEISFSNNYTDMCHSHGVEAGFQFEFYCERCSDRWRTEFVPYRKAQASGWLSRAAGLLGGHAHNVGRAIDGLADAGWGNAKDEAFKEAIEQAKRHFHRCAKCFQYVCDQCWNSTKGLCLNCAPVVEIEIEAARARAEASAAVERADEAGSRRGQSHNVDTDAQLVCPKCRAQTRGAKFCPQCGHKLATKIKCPQCDTELSLEAKFCTECGHRMR